MGAAASREEVEEQRQEETLQRLENSGRLIVLDKPGGSGKVYLIGVLPGSSLSRQEVDALLKSVAPSSVYIDLPKYSAAPIFDNLEAEEKWRPSDQGESFEMDWDLGFVVSAENALQRHHYDLLRLAGIDAQGVYRSAMTYAKAEGASIRCYPVGNKTRSDDIDVLYKRRGGFGYATAGNKSLWSDSVTMMVLLQPEGRQILMRDVTLPANAALDTRHVAHIKRSLCGQLDHFLVQNGSAVALDAEMLYNKVVEQSNEHVTQLKPDQHQERQAGTMIAELLTAERGQLHAQARAVAGALMGLDDEGDADRADTGKGAVLYCPPREVVRAAAAGAEAAEDELEASAGQADDADADAAADVDLADKTPRERWPAKRVISARDAGLDSDGVLSDVDGDTVGVVDLARVGTVARMWGAPGTPEESFGTRGGLGMFMQEATGPGLLGGAGFVLYQVTRRFPKSGAFLTLCVGGLLSVNVYSLMTQGTQATGMLVRNALAKPIPPVDGHLQARPNADYTTAGSRQRR